MTVPLNNLPAYVKLDQNSPWHVSALISTALESMTLPSRLKSKNGTQETLDELAAALNVNGNQNIAKLQMSIGSTSRLAQQNDHGWSGMPATPGQNVDARMPSQERWGDNVEISDRAASSTLDMDFSSSNEPKPQWGRSKAKILHVFGEVESFRGHKEELLDKNAEEDEHGIDGRERARRRASGLPIVHRLVIFGPFNSLMRTSQEFRSVASYCGTSKLHAIKSRLYPCNYVAKYPCTASEVMGGFPRRRKQPDRRIQNKQKHVHDGMALFHHFPPLPTICFWCALVLRTTNPICANSGHEHPCPSLCLIASPTSTRLLFQASTRVLSRSRPHCRQILPWLSESRLCKELSVRPSARMSEKL